MDDADRSEKRREAEINNLIINRVTYEGESAEHCEDCQDPIPEQRRELIPGVVLCVPCAEAQETQQLNYRN